MRKNTSSGKRSAKTLPVVSLFLNMWAVEDLKSEPFWFNYLAYLSSLEMAKPKPIEWLWTFTRVEARFEQILLFGAIS